MTVAENVAFGLRVRRRPRARIRARVEELLELVRLEGHAGRYLRHDAPYAARLLANAAARRYGRLARRSV